MTFEVYDARFGTVELPSREFVLALNYGSRMAATQFRDSLNCLFFGMPTCRTRSSFIGFQELLEDTVS
jgi:hypothetical protein